MFFEDFIIIFRSCSQYKLTVTVFTSTFISHTVTLCPLQWHDTGLFCVIVICGVRGSLNSPRKSYPPQCSRIVLEGHSRNTIEVAQSWQRATNITLKSVIRITIKSLYWKQLNNVILKVHLRMIHNRFLYRSTSNKLKMITLYTSIIIHINVYLHTPTIHLAQRGVSRTRPNAIHYRFWANIGMQRDIYRNS